MHANDELADHYLRSAAIGAIFADADGAIGITDAVRIECPTDRVTFCCIGGRQHKIADRARSLLPRQSDRTAAVAAIRQAAGELLIGLTPHETVIARAKAQVAKVEQKMADMQKSGALKAMNREFKTAREAGLASSYSAFVHAKKLALLDAMARIR